jgi:hypothetical protein
LPFVGREKVISRMAAFALVMLGSVAVLAASRDGSSQNRSASAPAAANSNLLSRRYHEGETLAYHMKGINDNWRYEINAHGVVKKGAGGGFVEEYSWSNLVSNRPGDALPPAAANFRQTLSLSPTEPLTIPDFSKVLIIVGPITDMLTFYSDLLLASRLGKLNSSGDHFYFAQGGPNSWADGNYVLLGQDSIDFDLTLKEVNQAARTATLIVRHVPPARPQVKLPAEWMRAPVADTANNWVEVKKLGEGKYDGQVGKEIFDVELMIDLADGKILAATMDNPVIAIERDCTDAALASCAPPRNLKIHRQIEMRLVSP